LLATPSARHKRAPGLDGREPLVPQDDLPPRGVGEALGEAPRLARGSPFPAVHVEGQPDHEPHDPVAVGHLAQGLERGPAITPVERPARVGQEAELVVHRHPDAGLARVDPAGPRARGPGGLHTGSIAHLTPPRRRGHKSGLFILLAGALSSVMTPLRAVKGMNDVLPEEIGRWQRVERLFARTMSLHGFREVRTPYLEPTPLFVGAIGEGTDVVEKEMYSFEHHGEALTLRPEGTAGAARAYVEHAVHAREPVTRWWYAGPMFRAERPQRGRYRQFYQVGAEVFGDEGPGADAEMIDMLVAFLGALHVPDVEVLLNSLGSLAARARHREALLTYLSGKAGSLSEDSRKRLDSNPLRILDSKDERDQAAVRGAPPIHDFFDDADRAHFEKLLAYLGALGTPFKVDPGLVRGLDYYTRTLFEIKGAHAKLGAGSTLLGGGRYDTMVAGLGGPSVPAIGFAAGLERLLIASEDEAPAAVIDAFIAPLGDAATGAALRLARELRGQGVRCHAETRGGSLKSQLRRANALGAKVALILGDSEIAEGVVQVKDLDGRTQERMTPADAVRAVAARIASGGPPIGGGAP
jgi:histidyl-tRNA synthetase